MKTIKTHIYLQSFADIITNSSTEIFCQIQSNKELIVDICNYLNTIFAKQNVKCSVTQDGYSEEYLEELKESYGYDPNVFTIDFELEYGEYNSIDNLFIALLNEILIKEFGHGNFKINTDVEN